MSRVAEDGGNTPRLSLMLSARLHLIRHHVPFARMLSMCVCSDNELLLPGNVLLS